MNNLLLGLTKKRKQHRLDEMQNVDEPAKREVAQKHYP